jgi:hypothetical protein
MEYKGIITHPISIFTRLNSSSMKVNIKSSSSGGGQQVITGKPKILSSNYNMTQLSVTIKQRSDG